ncbi:MAG TPA: hypothetical protein DD381_07885 [Lentisphaeria bacterium]|nr:MAG: hypothetical protein A2X47_04450 [Lentisphaerae bacterium GWF2_38_69]HBM16241.1 hypothetical protein [Lentisphaeria bacterium]
MKKLNKNYILLLMASMFFMGMAGTDIYISALPRMVSDFNTTPNVINLTISIYTIGVAIFVVFADVLSNRFGRKPIIIISLCVYIVTSFLISLSPSIWVIVILRFIQSLVGFLFICTRQVLKDIMNQREQVRANGIILAGLIISPAIAPVIGAYLTHHFGWRSCFVFNGILGMLILILTLKILPETNYKKLKSLPKLNLYVMNYFHIFKDRFFLMITAIYASASGAFWAFIGISSYLYIDHLGVHPITYSYIYILMSVAYLLGNQYMLALNRAKASYNKIISIGVTFTLVGALVICTSDFFPITIVIIILVTLGSIFMRAANALTNPTTQVITINYFKRRGGLALGMAMSINYVAMSLGVFLVTLFHKEPLVGLILISLFFSFIGLGAFYIAKRRIAEHSKNF